MRRLAYFEYERVFGASCRLFSGNHLKAPPRTLVVRDYQQTLKKELRIIFLRVLENASNAYSF
jgi:hypothetical protein